MSDNAASDRPSKAECYEVLGRVLHVLLEDESFRESARHLHFWMTPPRGHVAIEWSDGYTAHEAAALLIAHSRAPEQHVHHLAVDALSAASTLGDPPWTPEPRFEQRAILKVHDRITLDLRAIEPLGRDLAHWEVDRAIERARQDLEAGVGPDAERLERTKERVRDLLDPTPPSEG